MSCCISNWNLFIVYGSRWFDKMLLLYVTLLFLIYLMVHVLLCGFCLWFVFLCIYSKRDILFWPMAPSK